MAKNAKPLRKLFYFGEITGDFNIVVAVTFHNIVCVDVVFSLTNVALFSVTFCLLYALHFFCFFSTML